MVRTGNGPSNLFLVNNTYHDFTKCTRSRTIGAYGPKTFPEPFHFFHPIHTVFFCRVNAPSEYVNEAFSTYLTFFLIMSANLDHSMFATISRLSNILAYSYFMLYKSFSQPLGKMMYFDKGNFIFARRKNNGFFLISHDPRYQYPDILRDSECFQAEILSNCDNTFKVVSIH